MENMKNGENVEVIEVIEETEKVSFLNKIGNGIKKINIKRVGIGTAIGCVGLVAGYVLGKRSDDDDYLYESDDTCTDDPDVYTDDVE